jgi:hypothetical protein
MSKIKDVFISYAHRDRGLAEKLIKKLQAHDISISAAENLEVGEHWQMEIEQAVKSADAVIVLVDPKREPDSHQQFEWSAALEAEWEDSSKRLIPLLLGNAEPPSFLLSRQALRVKNPKKEWNRALDELVRVLNKDLTESAEFGSIEEEDPSKRCERLQYIEKTAHTLKTL